MFIIQQSFSNLLLLYYQFSLATKAVRPLASQAVRRTAQPAFVAANTQQSCRFVQTVKEGLTATDAWNKSCYSGKSALVLFHHSYCIVCSI